MVYFLWVISFVFFLGIGLVFLAVLKKSSPEDNENSDDLEEWDCPSCGFRVQLGKECIYCGEKKPAK